MVQITPHRVLIPGITFQFSGVAPTESNDGEFFCQDLVVPPLNLGALNVLQGRLQSLKDSQESMTTLCEALEFALARNYSGVPRWLIEQTIDLANMAEMMRSIMDISGLRRKEIEAEKKAQTDLTTGATSFATS
jgi:hypothetical protein